MARRVRPQLTDDAPCTFVRGQHLRSLASKENAADLDVLRGLFEHGQLSSAMDRTFALPDTAVAVRYLMDGRVRAKVAITM